MSPGPVLQDWQSLGSGGIGFNTGVAHNPSEPGDEVVFR
jgi:hypothetical protein